MGKLFAALAIGASACTAISICTVAHGEDWIAPVRESAQTRDHLTLGIKHFVRQGAQPILLVHGLAQNDRGWDAGVQAYSFARFLYEQGFDVWVGNLRAAGTPGFRSDTPPGPHHWTVEDYAIYDIPALVDAVRGATGQAPWVFGHSMAAWALNGYLDAIDFEPGTGRVVPHEALGLARQSRIRGIVTLAGVYNVWWPHALTDVAKNPIRSVDDYYQSNYELELLARAWPLYHVVPYLPGLPLGWIGSVLNLPLDRIPWVGSKLRDLYGEFQDAVIETPVLSMFNYAPDADPDVLRLHSIDGLEDLGPHLVEQLGNAILDHHLSSYYHLDGRDQAYRYAHGLSHVTVPMLFVAGGRDRLANIQMIYRDGYEAAQTSAAKDFLGVENFGHLDILNGLNAPQEVWGPVVDWVRSH